MVAMNQRVDLADYQYDPSLYAGDMIGYSVEGITGIFITSTAIFSPHASANLSHINIIKAKSKFLLRNVLPRLPALEKPVS